MRRLGDVAGMAIMRACFIAKLPLFIRWLNFQ